MSHRFHDINRRRFLACGSALAMTTLSPWLLPKRVHASTIATEGNGTLSVVSDGYLSLPRSFLYPDSIDRSELDAVLTAHNLDTTTLTPDCNVTIWRTGERLILFDVGSGPNFMPTAGQLVENLFAIDIDPADVTDVVFTHAHPDHLWGLLDDFDELICPNATYHMSATEWDYWRADDTLDKTPDARKSFVVGAQNRFPLIEDVMQLFAPGEEILPGVEAVATHGHTPGHTSFNIHSGNDSIMLVGDALTNVAVSFAKPAWHTNSDQNPEQGAATRLKLLDRLSADQSILIGYHLPQSGIGRVAREKNAYRFVVD